MKQGRALVDLAMEIQGQANAKADFVAESPWPMKDPTE